MLQRALIPRHLRPFIGPFGRYPLVVPCCPEAANSPPKSVGYCCTDGRRAAREKKKKKGSAERCALPSHLAHLTGKLRLARSLSDIRHALLPAHAHFRHGTPRNSACGKLTNSGANSRLSPACCFTSSRLIVELGVVDFCRCC